MVEAGHSKAVKMAQDASKTARDGPETTMASRRPKGPSNLAHEGHKRTPSRARGSQHHWCPLSCWKAS
eukprot:6517450-Pyramimonas_sp.AAC.1